MAKPWVASLVLFSLFAVHAADKPLTLDDLGMKESPIQPNTKLQDDLATRSTMLKWHQWLGIAALVPMAGNYILGDTQGHDVGLRNAHTAMGIATAALYMGSATFAIFAPKPDGVIDTGSTKWHRWLSYIHFPLMIAVPILGNYARQQVNNGEKLSGAGALHGPAATTLLVTYSIAITVMVFNF
jgi:hypothetical protein